MGVLLVGGLVALLTLPNLHCVLPHFQLVHLDVEFSQEDLAKAVSVSQSRIGRMEAGDASVSLDLLVRSLLATRASNSDLAKIIVGSRAR